MSEKYRVERDGEKDLVFEGEIVASVDGRIVAGREMNRWDEYTLYKTLKGKYILEHQYITLWQGERNLNEAWIGDDPAETLKKAGFDQVQIPRLIKDLAKEAGIDIAEHVE